MASTLRSRKLRENWASQLKESIQAFRSVEAFWRDIKPDQIIIDLNGDIWLINLGGSWTNGRIDEESQETVDLGKATRKVLQGYND